MKSIWQIDPRGHPSTRGNPNIFKITSSESYFEPVCSGLQEKPIIIYRYISSAPTGPAKEVFSTVWQPLQHNTKQIL